MKGKNKYVPPIFLDEMEQVKKAEGIYSDAEGFRRMAQYAKKGRTAIDMNVFNSFPRPRRKHKKGTLSQLFFVFITIFGLALASVIAYYVFDNTFNEMLDVDVINQSEKTKEAFESAGNAIDKLDYVIFFVFIGMVLALFIASWFIAGNPIYVWMYFIGLGMAILVSAILSNVWDSFFIAKLLSLRAAFPLLDNLWNNMPIYLTIVGLVSMIIMYSKGRFE